MAGLLWAAFGREGQTMGRVRVLVGTRKGAFVLSADGTRKAWTVDGPHFPGWEVYHVKGSPVDQLPLAKPVALRRVR